MRFLCSCHTFSILWLFFCYCAKLGSSTPTGKKRNSLIPRVTNFPCPGCQHDIDLGERGISGLFRNFTLENIVERYRQAARAAVAIMCNLCKPPPVEATKSCMDCKASYCNECFKMHHPWGTPKAQHEYVGPTTNFRPKVWSSALVFTAEECHACTAHVYCRWHMVSACGLLALVLIPKVLPQKNCSYAVWEGDRNIFWSGEILVSRKPYLCPTLNTNYLC